MAAEWKAELAGSGYRPVSVNAMLAAVNKFFTCMGREDCKVKYLKLQRQMFRKSERELTKAEYLRLVQAAREKENLRLELLLETICATGIRVGEVKYITVEAAQTGAAEIALKGKIRTILLPNRLCRKLLRYAKKQKITSGKIFLTRGGMGLSRKYIWAEMKNCAFYNVCHDVVRLADVLGHSSIETTRIYLLSTGKEYARQLDRLGLVQ